MLDGCPPILILPVDCGNRSAITFSNVVLPVPLGPRSVVIVPLSNLTLIGPKSASAWSGQEKDKLSNSRIVAIPLKFELTHGLRSKLLKSVAFGMMPLAA